MSCKSRVACLQDSSETCLHKGPLASPRECSNNEMGKMAEILRWKDWTRQLSPLVTISPTKAYVARCGPSSGIGAMVLPKAAVVNCAQKGSLLCCKPPAWATHGISSLLLPFSYNWGSTICTAAQSSRQSSERVSYTTRSLQLQTASIQNGNNWKRWLGNGYNRLDAFPFCLTQ